MKKFLFLITFFCALKTNAQNYLITFAGTGASTFVNTVKVENLTAGTSVALNGSDVLRLTIITGINSLNSEQLSEAKIFPNPMTDNSILQVYPPVAGEAVITLHDMAGKLVAQFPFFMENNLQEFRLTGVGRGLYLISVMGNTYTYSVKLLSNGKSSGTINIEQINNNQSADIKTEKRYNKGIQVTVDMNYTIGDRLKFTGSSDIYSTIITDIPESDKTITFNFIACTDGDNNNYSVVKIGTQTWMGENLKTTKYRDGITSIPNITASWNELTTPAYCWYNNDEGNFKATYGALYNWHTLNTGNLCPAGWHVPTDAEWTTLENYLIANGFNYDGTTTGNKYAKALASTNLWTSVTTTGVVGNTDYPAKRNATGFTALPGGYRYLDGSFSIIGFYGYWWSATEYDAISTWGRYLLYHSIDVGRSFLNKEDGLSVRCLRD